MKEQLYFKESLRRGKIYDGGWIALRVLQSLLGFNDGP